MIVTGGGRTDTFPNGVNCRVSCSQASGCSVAFLVFSIEDFLNKRFGKGFLACPVLCCKAKL